MKRVFLCLALCLCSATAFAKPVRNRVVSGRLAKVCPKIVELGENQYKTNSPVRARLGDNSSSITRFALNPTIIFIVGNPAFYPRAIVYDKAGNYLTSGTRLGCDRRGRGVCNSRYKGSELGGNNTRSVRRTAMQNTGSPEIFWKVSDSTCYRIPDAGRCYNVKIRDLCNGRTLR